MLVRRTDYYNQFHCIAKDCPATCCAGWEIAIDSKSMKRYNEMEGALGNRIHNSIHQKRGSFEQYNGRCIFLNDEQLCDLYIEAGPDMLCHTCKTYPRHVEDYEGERDLSLAISCPEVARIILGKQEPVQWVVAHNKKPAVYAGDFNTRLYEIIKQARSITLSILQKREIPIQMRMAIALAMSHDLQRRVQKQDMDGMLRLLHKYPNPMVLRSLQEKIKSYRGREHERHHIMKKMLKTMSKLTVLNPEWKQKIQQARKMIRKLSNEEYERLYHDFWEERESSSYEVTLEQLVCYFTMSYYCTSIYDEEIYAKMKFSIFSSLVIQELWFLIWLGQGKELKLQTMIQIAYQYGREVEHLDENLNELDRLFIKKKYYCLEEFLIALL